MPHPLGRKIPLNFDHVAKYALTPDTLPTKPTPVVLGINWYTRFDDPQQIGTRFWAARPGDNLGTIRGGHAICAKPGDTKDYLSWWDYYNQGPTGRCVGFSLSRMMTLLNRVKYDAVWLYDKATEIDSWPGEHDPNSGTSVDAGCSVLQTLGEERPGGTPDLAAGISAYRWATSIADVHSVLMSPLADTLGAVPLVNSWGRAYPHFCWLPDEVLDRLLNEQGEAAVVTDR